MRQRVDGEIVLLSDGPMYIGNNSVRQWVDRANHYSIGHLFEISLIYLFFSHCDETKSESWPLRVLMGVLPE